MKPVAELAGGLVREGVAPNVAAGCAARRGAGFVREVGGEKTTYFDLASLTKPMTAVAAMRTGLPLSAPLGRLVLELLDTPAAALPVEPLLSHRAGLAAHVPLFAPLLFRAREGSATGPMDAASVGLAYRAAAAARRPECLGPPPEGGFPPLYSDVGYILAGLALAQHAGTEDAGAAIERAVVTPLGAAGEIGTARALEAFGHDLGEEAAPTEEVSWRGGVVRGRVHDENAWALTGTGGSGHAGMFGRVDAVLSFGCALLDGLRGDGPLAGANVAELIRERPGGTLRMGFDGKSLEGSSAGRRTGPRTFGHLGFTGTSLWIDPDAEVVTVLLTNRVHPSRESTAIRTARPRAHDALFDRATALKAGV